MAQRAIAAREKSKQPVFVHVPEPLSPGAGEVLCRTLQLGVCGTDREILESAHPLLPDGEDSLVLGHECLARVESVGDGVNELTSGQLVIPTVRRPIGESGVRVDLLSFGEYTERGIVRQHGFSQPRWVDRREFLLPIDEEISPVAVLAEPLAVAEKAVNEALLLQRARLGKFAWTDSPPRVLITGMGPIAFAAAIACVARDWPSTMLGRDNVDTYRARLAHRLGAQYVNSERVDLSPDNLERHGYDLILECTGSDEVLLAACGALDARGVAVWLGASRRPQPAPHNVARLMRHAVVRNHLHLGSVNAAQRDFADALSDLRKLQRSNPDELAALITTRVTPDSSLLHFERRMPQGIKVVLMYE